jgi:hypothetical protein
MDFKTRYPKKQRVKGTNEGRGKFESHTGCHD